MSDRRKACIKILGHRRHLIVQDLWKPRRDSKGGRLYKWGLKGNQYGGVTELWKSRRGARESQGRLVSINWGGASDSCIRMKVNASSALEIYGDQ